MFGSTLPSNTRNGKLSSNRQCSISISTIRKNESQSKPHTTLNKVTTSPSNARRTLPRPSIRTTNKSEQLKSENKLCKITETINYKGIPPCSTLTEQFAKGINSIIEAKN